MECSPGACRIHGRPAAWSASSTEEILARYHAGDRPIVRAAIGRAMADGRGFSLDLRVVRDDGAVRNVQLDAFPDQDEAGGTLGLFGLIRDVTEARQAIMRLRESENRFRSLVENMRNIIFCRGVKGDGPFGYRDGGSVMYGRDAGILAGTADDSGFADVRAWYESVHPDDRPAYLDAERARKEEGRPYLIEYRFRHPRTGQLRWAREAGWTVEDPQSGTTWLDSYIVDVTTLKEAQAQAEEARRAAEEANQAKSAFFASVSHELRTPLNAVLGFAEIMDRQLFGPVGNERYADYVRSIRDSGRILLGLIDDLLDLSKIEAGKQVLREEWLDVRELCCDVLRLMEPQAAAAQLVLQLRASDGLPLLCADARAVRQILLNLLSNALKFTPPGGRVLVGAKVARDGGLSLTVTDSGIGISPEDVRRLFLPYSQTDSSLASPARGTGLGLMLVRSLCELHGGSAKIRSRPGKGTKVWARFPQWRLTAADSVPPLSEPASVRPPTAE